MRFYKALQEKSQYFIKRNLKIDKLSDLLELLKEFDSSGKSEVLFRGQPEAKFMLYSSLQRLWIDRKLEKHYESYRELIINLINNSKEWNTGLITRYLRNSGRQENDMSILSIMQHYGVPTPLLDFTYDISKSLFFAIQSLDSSPPGSEIERYFSIYFIYRNNPVLALSHGHAEINLDLMLNSGITLIDNDDEAYRIQNNLNILNQEGAFIFNSSPKDPLEKHYYKYVSKLSRTSGTDYPPEIGGCININKTLAIPIQKHLQEKGINNRSMFPDLNQLQRDILNREWAIIRGNALSARRDSNPRPAD